MSVLACFQSIVSWRKISSKREIFKLRLSSRGFEKIDLEINTRVKYLNTDIGTYPIYIFYRTYVKQ